MIPRITLHQSDALSRRAIQLVAFFTLSRKTPCTADVILTITIDPTRRIDFTFIAMLTTVKQRIFFALSIVFVLRKKATRHTADIRVILILNTRIFKRTVAIFKCVCKRKTFTLSIGACIFRATHHAGIDDG
jgi:hypothetical protein